MRRSRVLIGLTLIALIAFGAPTASAGAPEVEYEFEETFGPDPFIPFCGFELLITTEVSVRHVHHDVGRDLVQHLTWVEGVDTVWRVDDPEKMVSGRFRATDSAILNRAEDEGIVRIHGVHWHLAVPGLGTVFHEAGQVTLDLSLLPEDPFVSFTGRSDWASGSFDDLCAALS
jgi:hypothetical protein